MIQTNQTNNRQSIRQTFLNRRACRGCGSYTRVMKDSLLCHHCDDHNAGLVTCETCPECSV
jgi:hypothetical protein